MSWEMFVSLKVHLSKEEMNILAENASLSADGAQQGLACKLKLFFVNRKLFSVLSAGKLVCHCRDGQV